MDLLRADPSFRLQKWRNGSPAAGHPRLLRDENGGENEAKCAEPMLPEVLRRLLRCDPTH